MVRNAFWRKWSRSRHFALQPGLSILRAPSSQMERTMADPFADDLAQRKPMQHAVGQDLSALSVDEIDERVSQLQAEIARLQDARKAKMASRDAASAFFKS
ncbi:hypothetical protein GCM10007036_39840 [Alsobacter metallidurans]|uniref:DUF1192 domain-containing protein n=2 Tax=Alsobacter metallidurans TaxID=340221 RepID=A0A917IA46_9HYPH|nr:hypothetical protein GCM10007036_39840 [Alsobacter metallidurans]